jgi:hypothetical protein
VFPAANDEPSEGSSGLGPGQYAQQGQQYGQSNPYGQPTSYGQQGQPSSYGQQGQPDPYGQWNGNGPSTYQNPSNGYGQAGPYGQPSPHGPYFPAGQGGQPTPPSPYTPPPQPSGYGAPGAYPGGQQPGYGTPPSQPPYGGYGGGEPPQPPRKKGMPGWGWALIGVGALALIGIIVAIVLVVTSALAPVNTSGGGGGDGGAASETPTESETPTPTPTDAASDGVISLDEYGVFEADPDLVVDLPSSWEQTVTDDDGQDVWESNDVACSFDTIVDSVDGGDTDEEGGDETATLEIVESDAEDLLDNYSDGEVVDTGGAVTLLTEDDVEIEFMTSEVDYVTDDGADAYFLIGTRVFADSGMYLSFALSCDSAEDPSLFDDVVEAVTVSTS